MFKIGIVFTSIAAGLVVSATSLAQERQPGRRSQAVPGKEEPHPPKVGEDAPDFELKNLDDQAVSLKRLSEDGPVVLLVLRGWPGYQCPICNRQVAEFLKKKDDFGKTKASVVIVYPGPSEQLEEHAKEFLGSKKFPKHFQFLTDPDYTFTSRWGLRWEAPKETAYPSTFVIGKDLKVHFGKTSTSHGGRSSVDEVLEELSKLK